MRTIFILIILFFHSLGWSQNSIREDAKQMGEYLLKSDFEHYVNYTYPKVMKDMGGRQQLKQTLKKQMEELLLQGVNIESIKYGEPSVILKEKKELQATLPQEVIFKTPNGKILSTSSLICISQNDGESWYFIDPGERTLDILRITLPNLSKKLIISPPQTSKLVE